MNPLFKAMQPKKKRPVDPNAPPRPNLMTHDVKIRQANEQMARMEQHIAFLTQRVNELESKLRNQGNYLNAVHQHVQRRS